MITLLYFAQVSEQLNINQEQLDLPPDTATLADLRHCLAQRDEQWQTVFNDPRLMMAVNQTMAKAETAINDGDEIAFFPPVTGG
jgi:molybdopterin synthase sulfur carrier subunit